MSSIVLPASLERIGSAAFDACAAMTMVLIPRGVLSIGESPFARCLSLTSIVVDAQNANYASLNGVLFNRKGTVLIQCPGGKSGSFAVPNSVTNIGHGAFFGCAGLSAVTLPAGLRRIGDQAFLNCSLTRLSLPANLTSIGDSAFRQSSLTNITIPDGVTELGPRAFQGCGALVSAEVGNYVPRIGTETFLGCWNLTILTIGTNVREIGDRAFQGCISLTNIVIPDSVTKIGIAAFAECSGLTRVSIPSNVNSIGEAPFSFCLGLATIDVHPLNASYASLDGVLYTRNLSALVQCPAARTGSYSVPPGVVHIGADAFASCNYLTRITLPDSVTSLGDEAIFGCASLTNVVVGDGVASIGREAFEACTALQRIFFRGNAPELGPDVFTFDEQAKVYYLPGTVGWGMWLGDRPTAVWALPAPLIINHGPSFGLQSHAFGFRISWATNIPVIIEACTNLAAPNWSPFVTNTLTDGWTYFSDPERTNYPSRLYRVRSQ